MGHDPSVDDTGVGLDLCEKEQSALARRYVLTQTLDTSEPWSHAGPRSISPFAPCASSRVPHILDAARLDKDSVLWDLGCGDGRVLHEAAARYGCRCVGVEIDAPCLAESERRAEAMGEAVSRLCSWHLRDATALPAGSLGADDAMGKDTPSPTVLLLFITGHGLCALSRWLKDEWEKAAKPFAVVTCVEALDSCVDWYGVAGGRDDDDTNVGGNPLFDAPTNPNDWTVYRDSTHAKYGVFVTPPRGVSVDEWAKKRPRPRAADPASANASPFVVVRDVFDESDVSQIESLVERLEPGFFAKQNENDSDSNEDEDRQKRDDVATEKSGGAGSDDDDEALAAALGAALLDDDDDDDAGSDAEDEKTKKKKNLWSAAEDACHAHRSHRVVHLHARSKDDHEDAFSKYAPRARAKLLRAAYDADARFFSRDVENDFQDDFQDDARKAGFGFARGRSLFVRSAEYHAYEAGGGVVDPAHRDTGSVLTVSVVLEAPSLNVRDGRDDDEKETRRKNSGGAFCAYRDDDDAPVIFDASPPLRRGDAVVFPSEKRHGVTPLVGKGARRRSVVLELWEGGVTRKNRQE